MYVISHKRDFLPPTALSSSFFLLFAPLLSCLKPQAIKLTCNPSNTTILLGTSAPVPFLLSALLSDCFSPMVPWGRSPSIKAASLPTQVRSHASFCTQGPSSNSSPISDALGVLTPETSTLPWRTAFQSKIKDPQATRVWSSAVEMNKWCRVWLINS